MVCSSLSMIQTMCWIILLDRKTFFFISHEYNENSENQFLSNHLFFCVKIPWFSAAQQAVHWTNIHKLNSRWRHFCMTSSPYSENILNKKPMFALQNALLYQSLQVAYIYYTFSRIDIYWTMFINYQVKHFTEEKISIHFQVIK